VTGNGVATHMSMVRHPQDTSVSVIDPPDGRSISVDIGPFDDQADLLNFAMLLETMHGIGHIDLIDAEPETALFVVRAQSSEDVAAILARVPDYSISTTTFGNMVSARIEESAARAAVLYAGAAAAAYAAPAYTEPLYVRGQQPQWWRRAALAAAAGAAAAGVLFIALNGVPSFRTTSVQQPRVTPAPAASIPTAFVPPVAIPTIATPAASPPPTATPAVPTASPTATATATATPTPTPVAILARRYAGSFSSSLGSLQALNACVWQTPVDGNISMTLTQAADGSVSGQANLDGLILYQVTQTPAGATCNAATVQLDASGAASGSTNALSASLTGPRDLVVTFNGYLQGDVVIGDVTLQRAMSTASSFGNTSETRTTTVSGITLSRS
jgi:hypothetical protein